MKSLVVFRKQLGLTQEQWAGILGTSKGQLAMAETGQRSLPPAATMVFVSLKLLLPSLQVTPPPAIWSESARIRKEKWLHKMEKQQKQLAGKIEAELEKMSGWLRFMALSEMPATQNLFAEGSFQQKNWLLARDIATRQWEVRQEALWNWKVQLAGITAALEEAKKENPIEPA